MNLNDRSILLTGAGSGIGRSLAMLFADRGARITLVGRRQEPLEHVAALVEARGGTAHVVPADITDSSALTHVVEAAQERFGGIDILVNNAGNVEAGRLENVNESVIRAQIDLNLTAPILLTRLALPALRASGSGLVINVSSGFGMVGFPFYATYAATKAGIAHFGESLRRELYGEGVHVLNVFPMATTTPMMESSNVGPEHGVVYETPEEVAESVVAGIEDGSLAVLRGGESQAGMVAMNRDNPAALDEALAQAKPSLEVAVAGHSSI